MFAVTVGLLSGVITMAAVFEHIPFVAVTTYVVVTTGLAMTFGPTLVFKLEAGLQL